MNVLSWQTDNDAVTRGVIAFCGFMVRIPLSHERKTWRIVFHDLIVSNIWRYSLSYMTGHMSGLLLLLCACERDLPWRWGCRPHTSIVIVPIRLICAVSCGLARGTRTQISRRFPHGRDCRMQCMRSKQTNIKTNNRMTMWPTANEFLNFGSFSIYFICRRPQ